MGQKTPLYTAHQEAGAKIVDFSGWEMPLHYGSQLEEHHTVRKDAGMFDVSHMAIIDVMGEDAAAYLRYLLANNIDKLKQSGRALYSCLLNEKGGIIDDLIVYFFSPQHYRLVVNASRREPDLAWLNAHKNTFNITITMRTDLAIIAIQGPLAKTKVAHCVDAALQTSLLLLKPFHSLSHQDYVIACTGYTGEDGLEIMLPGSDALNFWRSLQQAGVKPCGLGARDTLRLEAGLNLYGADMDETTSPLTSNLAWTVAFEPACRDFIGKQALLAEKTQGITHKLVGIILKEKGVLRNHQRIVCANGMEGEITSGSFSPTLGVAIALARLPIGVDTECKVDMRGKTLPVRIVSPPFVKQGLACVADD